MIYRLGFLLLLLALIGVACSAPQNRTKSTPDVRLLVHDGGDWTASDFQLTIEPASGGTFRVALTSHARQPTTTLLVELRFDSSYSATDLQTLDLDESWLALAAAQPGVVALGAINDSGSFAAPSGGKPLIVLSATLTPGARSVALAPQGERGQVLDLASERVAGNILLSWRYVNRGDYDQNSEVNAADLVPIAGHFGKRADDLAVGFPFSEVESVVDGDGNGEINAADIAPIAGNLLRRVTHYRVFGSAEDTGAGGTLELVAELPFSAGVTDPGLRRVFGIELSDLEQLNHAYYFVAPWDNDDASLGPLSNPAGAGEHDTEPPVWIGSVGITGAIPRPSSVNVTWGEAQDALSPPVVYVVYWNEGDSVDFESAQTLEASAESTSRVIGGLTNGVEYAFAVRARDSANPPNYDANENQLTAIPADWLFDSPGPSGLVETPAQFPALALLPGGEMVRDAAPMIAHTRPADDDKLRLTYRRLDDWRGEAVLPGLAFSHIQVLVSDTRRWVVAYDATLRRVMALRFTPLWEPLASVVLDNIPAGRRVLHLSADYDADSDQLGVAYALGNDGEFDTVAEVRFAEYAGGQVNVAPPLRPLTSGIVQGVVFRYDPLGGDPWLLYTHGVLDREPGYVLSTELVEARRTGGAWVQTEVPHAGAPLKVDLTFDAAGEPQLAFVGAHSEFYWFPGKPFRASLKLDGYVGTRVGGVWDISRFYNASLNASIENFDQYRIILRGLLDVRWAAPGELAASIVDGYVIVHWFTLEPEEDSLQINSTYRTSADGYAENVAGVLDAPALAMSWQSQPHSAVAYIHSPTITGAELWDRYFEPAGPLHYVMPPP